MIKGLIFDFDGLILDTETPEYHALNEVYADFGQNLPVELFGQTVGYQYNQHYEPVKHLQQLTGMPVDANAFWERVNRRRMEIIHTNQVLPGVTELLISAKHHGLKLAVASSSPHSWVDDYLRQHGLFDYFDVIKCGDDVQNTKPAPDLFLAALAALHLRPDEAIIFEDSSHGVMAARRAGVRVVAVPNFVTKHTEISGATMYLGSLAEVSLDVLMARLSG